MKPELQGSKKLWWVYGFFVLASLLSVFSATEIIGIIKGNTFVFILKHFVMISVSFFLLYFFHKIKYTFHYTIAFPFLVFSIVLLGFTLLSGVSLNQASRWIVVPGLGFTVQTSDIAKFALVSYLASVLYSMNNNNTVRRFKPVLYKAVLPTLFVVALIFPANLSTAMIVLLVSFLLIWIAGGRLIHLVSVGLVLVILMGGFIMIAPKYMKHNRVSTWKKRVETFFSNDKKTENPDADYQAVQAKIAIATGGFFGKGPGNSAQKSVLPHPYSDFIYAIILEEYGFVGGFLVILAYWFLLFWAVRDAYREKKMTFRILLRLGITLVIVVQAFTNMGDAVGIFPVTGQPLPLISMGGTSYIMSSMAYGVLIATTVPVKKNITKKQKSTENNEEEKSENTD